MYFMIVPKTNMFIQVFIFAVIIDMSDAGTDPGVVRVFRSNSLK